jgi:hypothetical protein
MKIVLYNPFRQLSKGIFLLPILLGGYVDKDFFNIAVMKLKIGIFIGSG